MSSHHTKQYGYKIEGTSATAFCGLVFSLAVSVFTLPLAAQDTSQPNVATPPSAASQDSSSSILSNVAAAFKAATDIANSAGAIDPDPSPLSSSQQSPQTLASGAPVVVPSPNVATQESFLTCPLDKLRSSYESVLAEQTTEVIDVLMVENEVLRICQARQSQINGILKITQSVKDIASELLSKKINGMANEWSQAQAELHQAKLAADLRHKNEAARIASEARVAPQPTQLGNGDVVASVRATPAQDPASSEHHGSCRPDYRVTAIYGAGGTTRATLLSPGGTQHRVKVGDILPFGAKVLAIGQGLVTIEVNGTRDVLAFDAEARTPSGPLAEEGFIVTEPGDPTDSATISSRLTPSFDLISGSGE